VWVQRHQKIVITTQDPFSEGFFIAAFLYLYKMKYNELPNTGYYVIVPPEKVAAKKKDKSKFDASGLSSVFIKNGMIYQADGQNVSVSSLPNHEFDHAP
jgi:hypothetical protein